MTERTYEPRGAAMALFRDRSSEVALCGAAGTGKTIAGLMKLHLTSLMVPGVQSLIVRQTHASLVASTLVAFEQFVARDEIAAEEVRWFGGSGSKPAGYRYRNGSMIMVGGMDNPGKVLSMSLDRVVVDEANQISVTAWETLLTRMRGTANTYKQAVCLTNPDHPDHWLKQRADDPDTPMRMYTSLHRDNPYLWGNDGQPTEAGKDYLGFLESLTGIRRSRYLLGQWAAAEGLVYGDEWRDDRNLIDFDQVPETNRIIWSVDFGYNNAFVWQEWRIDRDGRMYLTREISRKQRLVEDHARDILALVGDEYRPEVIICDHDSEDRATLERHLKMPTVAARKAVSRGVQIMQTRIRPAGDGKPRLYAVRGALQGRDLVAETAKVPRGFASEVNGYVWEMTRGADGIPKEAPAKVNDHSMDAARYAACYLDWNAPSRAHNPAAQRQNTPTTSSVWGRPVGR